MRQMRVRHGIYRKKILWWIINICIYIYIHRTSYIYIYMILYGVYHIYIINALGFSWALLIFCRVFLKGFGGIRSKSWWWCDGFVFTIGTYHGMDIMDIIPICEPWCWYMQTYIFLGDFGRSGKCWDENIPAPFCSHMGLYFVDHSTRIIVITSSRKKTFFGKTLIWCKKGSSLIGLDGDIAKENGDKLFRILPPMAHWSTGGRSQLRKPQILSNGGWFKEQHCWWKHGSFHHSTWQRRKNMGFKVDW